MSKQNSQSKGHRYEDISLIEWAINSTATGAGIFDILYCWRVAKKSYHYASIQQFNNRKSGCC